MWGIFMITKKCKNCKILKTTSEYYKLKQTEPQKYHAFCKICFDKRGRLQTANRRLLNYEKESEKQRTANKKLNEKNKLLKKTNLKLYNEKLTKKRASSRMSWFKFKEEKKLKKNANYQANKDRYKDAFLMKKYGITLNDFNNMLLLQNNKCKICKQKFKTKFDTNTDHCHSTGKVRGLLCNKCNLTLGNINDNVLILKNMIKYIEDSLPLQYKMELK